MDPAQGNQGGAKSELHLLKKQKECVNMRLRKT
jgi:hypothetical protein